MQIDKKLLSPIESLKQFTFKGQGYFYLQNKDGSYSLCIISREELTTDEKFKNWFINTSQKYIKEGRLFVNSTNNWTPISQ